MKTCFIFGALPVRRMPIIPNDTDFIIAADKGCETLNTLGLAPDIVIGDFDSLGYIPERENKIILPVRKDDTDVGYSLRYALENGFDRIYVYGAVGGSLDHTVANLQLSAEMSRKGILTHFFGDGITVCSVTDGKLSFPEVKEGRFSVFAVTKAYGVTIKGLDYETENAELDPFCPIGVSNAFIGKSSYVEVKKGTLTLLWEGNVTALSQQS